MPAREGTRQYTVRLPEETADRLDTVAHIEGSNLTDLFAEAVDGLVDSRRNDEGWQAQRRAWLDRQQKLAESMSNSDGGGR